MSEEIEVELVTVEQGGSIHEGRAQTGKPVKVFQVDVDFWDDGVVSPLFQEFIHVGRRKNTKVVYKSPEEFIKKVRTILPNSANALEDFIETTGKDLAIEDSVECIKIGKLSLTLYNDGFIEKDFMEIIRSEGRGAPKTWRLDKVEFQSTMKQLVGNAGSEIVKLLN